MLPIYTVARRGRSVRSYRFADASDSKPVYGSGTDVRASRGVRRPSGMRTHRQVGGRAPARAARQRGAGGWVPRRSELQTQRRLLGALPRPAWCRVHAPGSTCRRSSHRLCTVRVCATRCSMISIPSSCARSHPTLLLSRSSPRRARARRGCSPVASPTELGRAASRLATCWRSPSPARPPASSYRASGGSVSTAGSRRGPSTRSLSPSSGATPPNATARRRASSSARHDCWGRSWAAGARPPPSRSRMWPPRSSGPRRASSRPTVTRRRPTRPGGAPPEEPGRCRRCTRVTRRRSGAGT